MELGNKGHMLLYSTGACHLCEQASALLDRVLLDIPGAHYSTVDISDSDTLFDRYGWLIPVVRFADGSELNWPFDETALRQRLRALQVPPEPHPE